MDFKIIRAVSNLNETALFICRFFEKVEFNYLMLGVFLMGFVHHEKVLVSIDRTEWDFGKTQINILCAVVSIGKIAVSIYFEMLNNKSGNSNAEERIKLLKSVNIINYSDRRNDSQNKTIIGR